MAASVANDLKTAIAADRQLNRGESGMEIEEAWSVISVRETMRRNASADHAVVRSDVRHFTYLIKICNVSEWKLF